VAETLRQVITDALAREISLLDRWDIASAVGEGSIAISFVHRVLAE
jgi:hypothetical protein